MERNYLEFLFAGFPCFWFNLNSICPPFYVTWCRWCGWGRGLSLLRTCFSGNLTATQRWTRKSLFTRSLPELFVLFQQSNEAVLVPARRRSCSGLWVGQFGGPEPRPDPQSAPGGPAERERRRWMQARLLPEGELRCGHGGWSARRTPNMLPGDLQDLGLGPVPASKAQPVPGASQEAGTRERVAHQAAVWSVEAGEKWKEPERRNRKE